MLHDLGWHDPKDRWQDLRLALLYKTITGHVAIKSNQNDLVAAYNRTRANHIYKFRKIGASSAQFFPADSSTRSNYNFKFWGIGSNSTPYTLTPYIYIHTHTHTHHTHSSHEQFLPGISSQP